MKPYAQTQITLGAPKRRARHAMHMQGTPIGVMHRAGWGRPEKCDAQCAARRKHDAACAAAARPPQAQCAKTQRRQGAARRDVVGAPVRGQQQLQRGQQQHEQRRAALHSQRLQARHHGAVHLHIQPAAAAHARRAGPRRVGRQRQHRRAVQLALPPVQLRAARGRVRPVRSGRHMQSTAPSRTGNTRCSWAEVKEARHHAQHGKGSSMTCSRPALCPVTLQLGLTPATLGPQHSAHPRSPARCGKPARVTPMAPKATPTQELRHHSSERAARLPRHRAAGRAALLPGGKVGVLQPHGWQLRLRARAQRLVCSAQVQQQRLRAPAQDVSTMKAGLDQQHDHRWCGARPPTRLRRTEKRSAACKASTSAQQRWDVKTALRVTHRQADVRTRGLPSSPSHEPLRGHARAQRLRV